MKECSATSIAWKDLHQHREPVECVSAPPRALSYGCITHASMFTVPTVTKILRLSAEHPRAKLKTDSDPGPSPEVRAVVNVTSELLTVQVSSDSTSYVRRHGQASRVENQKMTTITMPFFSIAFSTAVATATTATLPPRTTSDTHITVAAAAARDQPDRYWYLVARTTTARPPPTH